MKKVMKTIMMLFVASTFVLTSCTTDEDVKDVELTMVPATATGTHFVSDSISILFVAKGNSDNSLKSIKITKAIAGTSGITTILDEKLSGTDYSYTLSTFFETKDVGINTYSITLTGDKGTAQTKTYTATVKAIGFTESTAGVPITLFGQGDANNKHFANLKTFTTLSNDEATAGSNAELKNNIDIAFYYGQTNKFTFSSLDDAVMHTLYSGLSSFWTSTTENTRVTGLLKVTGLVNYASIEASLSDKDLLLFADGKTYSKTVTDLKANDLVLFKTNEGKVGLLKIASTAGSTTTDTRIDFDGVVQK
ncbi:MAG: hypothetical protein KBE91_00230 [Bacteroidia bacterium]|nr:hypothetical protein [Bacteroidia bacterium]MBP9688007.1 hypothetical protein [Bacteroidia bacterium]